MSLKNTPRIEQVQSLHRQITRRVFPIVAGAFLVIGLIGMFTIRSTARANLGNSHEVVLASLAAQIDNELDHTAEDLRPLTSESVVRQFGLSAANMNSDLVNRNDVLNLFLQTIDSHPEKYLGIRYVNLDGRVVVQVSRTAQGTAKVDDPQDIASYREDEVFQRTIRSSPGEITLAQIALNIDETGPASIVRPVLRFSSPVRFLDTLDTVLGMIQVDVIVSDILDVVNLANQNDLYHEEGRRFVLSNNFDAYIADSSADDPLNLFGLELESSSEEAPGQLSNRPSSNIDSFLEANPGVLSVAENGNMIISTGLISTFNAPDMPWRLILIDDTTLALSESNTLSALVLLAALVAGFVVALVINTHLRNSLTPFDRATALAQQLAQMDVPEQLPVTTQSAQGDDLIQSMGQIANRIQKLNKSMDEQRSRLTRDVEIAARISRETALLNDLDGLINRVINLICEEYNFYHAQVFVVDDVGLNAVLAYSRGEAGQKLLAQDHKIAVGSESTIGLTTALGKPIIVNDTTAEAGRHTFNPILPETRAEMALPLFIGETVIGVLDVQSITPNVFQENELQAFQLLADQIAIAIYNGRLLMQSEERVHQIDSLNRQLTRAAWEKTQQTFALERAYHYDLRSIQEGTPAKDETEESLSMPIRIRGEVIGSLDVALPSSEGFSEGEQAILRAVTDRVALAIENARLFQETDLSLTETSILYEMSRQISEANQLDEIIEAIVRSVVSDASGGQIVEFDDYPAGDSPDWVTITADWSAAERNFQQVSLVGSRLRLTEHALFRDLHSSEIIAVGNIERDPRFDPGLRQALGHLSAGAMVVIPLSMRGLWRGLIMIEFQSPRQFREQELRLYTALIDQAGVAVDNRLLLHQTEKTLDLRERMYAASRSINTAQNIQDLVNAVLLTSDNPHLNFAMSLLEGPLGEYYWPKYERLVARSNNGVVYELNELYELSVAFESPLHARTPEIIRDEDPDRPVGDDNPNLLRMRAAGQRYSAIFPLFSANQPAALFYVTCSELHDMPEEDYEVYFALTGQMSTVLQNRRLLQQAENERQKLSSILDTLPAGVLVLDAQTFLPVQANSQIVSLFGRPVSTDQPFSSALYNLYRTGTQMNYIDNELPIFVAAQEGIMAFSDDLVVLHEDGSQIDLLMNAAPILDSRGNVVSIVAAIENISSLRGLENALQDNLRETIALYEATRALSEADEVEQILDVLIGQLAILEAGDAAVVLLDEETEQPIVARTLITPIEDFKIPTTLLKSRQQVIVEDVSDQKAEHNDETWTVLQASGVAAILTIPMRARNRDLPRGWVVVTYPETHSMSTEEERFLTTLSDGAATSLDNRYLFLSTQSALQEASILYQASRTLTNATSYEDILNAVIDYLIHPYTTQVFIAQLASPSWDSPESSALVVASWHTDESTIDLQDIELDEEQFLAWRQLSSRQIVAVEDIETDEKLTELERAGIGSLGLRSFIVLPLRVANRDIGAIWIGSSEVYRATDRDLRIYQSFAEQTSISLEASRLLTQTNRRARQLETSAQVSQFASSILDLDVLLPRLVDLIRNSFNYDHVQVFLMDREGEYALLRASTGEAGRQLLGIGHKLQKGSYSVIGTVTAQNKPILALDTGQADVVHRPNPYLPHTRSEMALPLVVKGKVVGALDVQSNRANAFSEEDVTVLTILAAQISVAIDNARLFEQAEHRANDMSLLFAVTTAAASAESLSGALQNVAEDLRDSLNALSVGIYLPTRYADEITDEMVTMMNIAAVAGSDQPRSEISEVKVGDSKNIIGTSAANFRSMIINKVEEENLYLPLVASARSAVVVPLTSASQLIGLITMEHADPFAYDHETLTLLQTMGGTLSAIIQNAQLLEQVQKQNDQLRELDRIKSEFLANMSHELRTPLNSIIGFSRVILKGIDGPLTEMQEQDLSTIYNSGQHLLGLINDILDQAKIASGKMDLKIDYFDIKPVVEGVRSIGIGLVKDKPININLDIQSGLQQVYGDEFRTRQVLLNLISNASKFTTEGSITLKVYTIDDTSRAQKMVRVDVIDTGIGIAQKDMPLLFEAFRQIDSSLTRTAGGTGLGLPISKSLVEMQGGDMIVHSQINVGSTFSITVPTGPIVKPEKQSGLITQEIRATLESPAVAPESNGTEVHETLRVNKSALQGEGRITTVTMPPLMMTKRQVLLIEDNQDRVDQFRRTIQREGFDVFTASIPLEAEAMASGLRPTLIVMDVNFSNGAGWNILSKLKDRDDTFDIPIIVVTLSDEKERAEALGVQSFLQHPIMPEQLTTAVLDAERESSMDRILIIDDQPESARLFTQLLDEHGQYRIFAAHNGIEGVSMVARRRPDLVILDLRMPEMDGFEVLQELRSNPETANIPVLVVTGDTLDAVEQNRLADVKIMYKTDISMDDYRNFIQGVETHLSRNGD